MEKKQENQPVKSAESLETATRKDPKGEKQNFQEVVFKIDTHCDGCAKRIVRSLIVMEGVEDVITDLENNKVIVKGNNFDPLKVLKRLQKKTNRQVTILSSLDIKEEILTLMLRLHMHCEACAMDIETRIMRMKGVENVETDFKASQVSVRGVFTPADLVEFIYRRTGKHALLLKQNLSPPMRSKSLEKDSDKEKEVKDKPPNEYQKKKTEEKNPKEGTTLKEYQAKDSGCGGRATVERKRNEYYYNYNPPRQMENMYAAPPPNFFSDENPNACTVM